MPRASGFALYRCNAGQWERQPDTGGFPLRPDGELIWLHVADPARFPLLNDLIARLKSNRDGVHVVLSFDEDVPDLETRLVKDLDTLIEGAGTVLVGNHYAETVERLKKAASERPVVDLTRLNREMTSDDQYQGICW